MHRLKCGYSLIQEMYSRTPAAPNFYFWDPLHISITDEAIKLIFGMPAGVCKC